MSESLSLDKRIKRIQNYIDRMPSLSTTVSKVLEVCNRPNSSPNDLNRVISLDPVLTGQVLKLINSAYLSLPNKITSLTRAIIMLGLNTVKNLALSSAILGTVSKSPDEKKFFMVDFWHHSISTGVIAKNVAAKLGIPVMEREEFFVAGLLHDLGKIPLIKRFPDEYSKVLDKIQSIDIELFEAEKKVFGLNHCDSGGLIAQKWKLNPSITTAMMRHHTPNLVEEEHFKIVQIIFLADKFSKIIDTTLDEADDIVDIPEDTELIDVVEALGTSWSELFSLKEKIVADIENATIFLNIASKR